MRGAVALALTAAILCPPLAAQESDPVAEFEKAVYFGTQYFGMKDYASAREQFARADALVPGQPAVLYNLAMLLVRTGRIEEAESVVARYLQLQSTGAEKQLVSQLQLQLEFQRELQRSRRIEQEYTELFNRGRLLYARNELDAALELFREAGQRRDREPAAVYDQGVVLEKKGDLAAAAARYRAYFELESDPGPKSKVEQHLAMLELEIEDMRTKIVCPFCGHRLDPGATWCHRCWRGPYATTSPDAAARACGEGTTVTRATYYAGDRLERSVQLECALPGAPREALRYSPSRQRAVQEARKAEGWTYGGEVIQSWRGGDGSEVRYVQGPELLERIEGAGGEILTFEAHRAGEAWLLDREEWTLDGIEYTSRFRFDAEGRIALQTVTYQNAAACNHFITMTAEPRREGDRLAGITIRGGYDGFAAEGAPRTDWEVTIANTFDEAGRLVSEDLALTSLTKTYTAKPQRGERDIVSSLYPGMRVKRPIADLARTGDLCGTAAGRRLTNLIDLRPFYPLSPNLAIVLPAGVVRAGVAHAYP